MATAAHAYWFHRRPGLACAIGAILTFVVGLLLAELSARAFFPEWAPTREERVEFWTYHDRLGWMHTPNQTGRFDHPDFSVQVAINSHGMRDSEYGTARTAKRRLLVLGDSFGWGFGVEHAQRFSELIESAHADWEILNASVSGYGTGQQLLLLQELGTVFRPDVVLVLFNPEDFENNVRGEQYWHFKPRFAFESGNLKLENVPVPEPTARQRLTRFLLGKTYLGPRLHALKNALADRLGTGRASAQSGDSKNDNVTYHLLAAVDDLCLRYGARFVLVSLPMESDQRAVLQRVAADKRIPYLALDPHFQLITDSVVFPHDSHWNERGHEIAAQAIDGFLARIGVFRASRGR
jgi:hypothetical protein